MLQIVSNLFLGWVDGPEEGEIELQGREVLPVRDKRLLLRLIQAYVWIIRYFLDYQWLLGQRTEINFWKKKGKKNQSKEWDPKHNKSDFFLCLDPVFVWTIILGIICFSIKGPVGNQSYAE